MGKSTTLYIWSCCYCGHGGLNANTTPVCVNCGVARCGNCHMESHKVRSGGSDPWQRREAREGTSRLAAAEGIEVKNGIRQETPARADPAVEQISEDLVPQRAALTQHRDLMRDLMDMKVPPKRQQGKTEGIVDTDVSDAETVVSAISSVTTLVDPGAVEDFAFSIMKFQSLGYLWPQLVGRCSTKKRCIHVIERLLKRYSKDLALVGQKVKASKMSGSQLCLTAARFVRRSRIQVAHKIWEAQFQSMDNSAVKNAVEDLSDTEVPNLEVDEDDNVPADDDLSFESIEEILFDKSPIFSLQTNIKLLVNLSNPEEDSIVYRLSTSFHTFMGEHDLVTIRAFSVTRIHKVAVHLCEFDLSPLVSAFISLLPSETIMVMMISDRANGAPFNSRDAVVNYMMTSKRSSQAR